MMDEKETTDTQETGINTPEYTIEKSETVIEIALDGNEANEPGLIDRIKSAVNNALESIRPRKQLDLQHGVFKALGDGFWMAAYTNNFMDRDIEILTRKAHMGFVDRVQRGFVDMPTLRFYHLAGSEHGKALWIDAIPIDDTPDSPVVLMAIGEFDETEVGKAAEKHYLEAGADAYRLSHGFYFPDWGYEKKDGVGYYTSYNTFEITTLPSEDRVEANLFTAWNIKEIGTMNMTDEIKKQVEERFGKGMLDQIEKFSESVKTSGKAISEMNIAHKDFVETTEDVSDEATEEATNDLEGQVLSEVLQDVGALATDQEQMAGLVKGAMEQMTQLSTRLDTAIAGFNQSADELKTFIQQTPQGVDDSKDNVVTGDEADKAKSNLKQREGEAQVDKFWGFSTEHQNGNGS